MQTFKQQVFLICLIFIFSGCASLYKPIEPQKLSYQNSNSNNDIELAYKYDVLREKKNKKYAKKEFKHNLNVVAVKITNNSDTTIVIGDNAVFFAGSTMINPVDPLLVKKMLQQSVAGYLPYLLFAPLNFTLESENTGVISVNIGMLLALGLTGGNMLVANSANKAFYKELQLYNLAGKKILKGETVYGIVGVQNTGFSPITLQRIKKSKN